MRVWIETGYRLGAELKQGVTLRVRVWIETRGTYVNEQTINVTLRVRVWIETEINLNKITTAKSHPPREGVD